MDGIINVKINGNHLTKDSRRAGVQHEGNATKLCIEFDKSWEDLAKVVTFWNSHGEHPVKVVLTTNRVIDLTADDWKYICPIPPEAMTESGNMKFVVDGYVTKTDAEGNVTHAERHRSVSDALEVIAAPYDPDADESVDPTPTQAEQLQVQIDTIKGTIQNAELSAISAANSARVSQESADVCARIETDALEVLEDIRGEHAEVIATANKVEQDANRAEIAAHQAEEIAGGNFATTADVTSALTTHNTSTDAHPIIDTVTLTKYRFGMENGLVYMEEVL